MVKNRDGKGFSPKRFFTDLLKNRTLCVTYSYLCLVVVRLIACKRAPENRQGSRFKKKGEI